MLHVRHGVFLVCSGVFWNKKLKSHVILGVINGGTQQKPKSNTRITKTLFLLTSIFSSFSLFD